VVENGIIKNKFFKKEGKAMQNRAIPKAIKPNQEINSNSNKTTAKSNKSAPFP